MYGTCEPDTVRRGCLQGYSTGTRGAICSHGRRGWIPTLPHAAERCAERSAHDLHTQDRCHDLHVFNTVESIAQTQDPGVHLWWIRPSAAMCPCAHVGRGGVSPHCRAPKQVPQRSPPYLRLAGAAAASGGGVTVTEVVAEARPMKLK